VTVNPDGTAVEESLDLAAQSLHDLLSAFKHITHQIYDDIRFQVGYTLSEYPPAVLRPSIGYDALH
jgi:hypothetical protein